MRTLKILAIIIVGVLILYFTLVSALSYYDTQTRKELMQTVARELPIGASQEQMTQFLRRHTSRFALDEQYHHVYGGFVPQTKWDSFWFGRQVQILFKLSPAGSLQETEILVFYTWL